MWAHLTTGLDDDEAEALGGRFEAIVAGDHPAERRRAPTHDPIPDTPGVNVGRLMAAMSSGVVT